MGNKKKRNNRKTRHHNNASFIGGANNMENITMIIDRFHRALHMLFETMPPHLMIQFIMKISCKPITDEVKDEIIKILTPKDVTTLYDPKTIANLNRFNKACHDYLWVKKFKT